MKIDQAGFEKLFRSGLIVFIDGECHLCHSTVQFMMKWEREPVAKFAAQQEFAPWMTGIPVKFSNLDTVVVVDQGQVYERSSAILRLLRGCLFPWNVIGILGGIVPPFIRDAVYRGIAKNRYAWFGKKDRCEWNPRFDSNRILNQI